MKKIFLLIAIAVNSMNVSAFRIEFGNNISINQPVYEDLYIAGGNITINAPIFGDLVIAGGTIIINDSVTNDILLAGGTVVFNGFVGDDIRCAGGNIRISKNVSGDVVITGGRVFIDKGVTIGGLLASGGDVTVDGNIMGKIKGVFGELTLNGNTTRDIDCRGGSITVNGGIGGKSILAAGKIIIGDNASFNNDVRYWNKKGSLDFKQSLRNGKAIYDPILRVQAGEWYYLGAATILGLLWYLGMAFVMISLLSYLFPFTMKKAADTVFNSSVKSLGSGFLFLIAVPVFALIACITLIGIPVGLILVFGYITLILLAVTITSVVASNWFNNRLQKKWNFWKLNFTAFGIFIVLKLVSLTPFVGWVIMLFLVCMSFGSILINVKWKRIRDQSAITENA